MTAWMDGATCRGMPGGWCSMIAPAFRLWLATWRPWRCMCGTRGFGAASRQQHKIEHWRAA